MHYHYNEQQKNISGMKSTEIVNFLKEIMANNTREWFKAHRGEYEAAKAEFEGGVAEAIRSISSFDPSISHITVKDATYRFYRDTRFSTDKSPYKNHLGAYIAAKGKKSLHGGYYLHIEPGHCLLACGNYWLPTNILTSCRNEIMGNIDEWLRCVESKEFVKYFGAGEDAGWSDSRGFGLERLKTCPSGFPRHYEHLRYLRMKDYCCWHHVPDTFFERKDWLDRMNEVFIAAKPMMDFVNSVIDDYE